MKPNDIKAAIQRAGTTQVAIAQYLGVSPSTMNQVISGRTRSARVEAEINKICGKAVFAAPRPAHRPRSSYNGTEQVTA